MENATPKGGAQNIGCQADSVKCSTFVHFFQHTAQKGSISEAIRNAATVVSKREFDKIVAELDEEGDQDWQVLEFPGGIRILAQVCDPPTMTKAVRA